MIHVPGPIVQGPHTFSFCCQTKHFSCAATSFWHAALICMNQISDGEGYLERTFLSPASIRATAVIISWMKDAGLTTYVCLCSAVVFSHFDLDIPISFQREGGLIKWEIFMVGLSRKILPKTPYWSDLIWWGHFFLVILAVFKWQT